MERKKKLLNFPKVPVLRTVTVDIILRGFQYCSISIIEREEKLITSTTGILADINSGHKVIKQVLNGLFNPFTLPQ